MAKSKTNKAKSKTPTVKPRRRGDLVQDRVTGNWSYAPEKPAPVKKPDETDAA